ncbi:hypothetical protein [Methylobacterium sp. J-068]|uniref:hypothetical protein n=1 Tax=Methylobacterium sp. J-068 TaxID=2836649 RepID=UPI001FB92623|nr:hypothetical protein [Methylobacterium sp. J-068]MCJ2033224.1 hypothetical protein [Methylobacterium sp. J-068]
MKTKTLALAATILGSLALGAGAATAAPMAVNGLQTDHSSVTQVRMDRSERMMMKKRMMRKQMMKRRMMKKRMMNRM